MSFKILILLILAADVKNETTKIRKRPICTTAAKTPVVPSPASVTSKPTSVLESTTVSSSPPLIITTNSSASPKDDLNTGAFPSTNEKEGFVTIDKLNFNSTPLFEIDPYDEIPTVVSGQRNRVNDKKVPEEELEAAEVKPPAYPDEMSFSSNHSTDGEYYE